MAKKKVRKTKPAMVRRRPRPTVCPFDESKTEPSYKNYQDLARFISDRGKILSREQTGVCARHQRRLSREIKRARHLALLPFMIRPL